MNLKFILIFSYCFLLINCTDAKKKSTVVSEPNKASLFVDLEGNNVAIEDYKGKRVLINFWATWCTPCLKEMPSMAKAQELLKDDNYVFLFATTDSFEKINQFKASNNYPFQFLQFKSTLDKWNIYALPATFVYDTNGEMAKRIDGATEWDSEEMLNVLRSIE